MTILKTLRLFLIPTPLHVLQRRLLEPSFDTVIEIDGEPTTIHFPSEYPGDALVLFPMMVEMLQANPKAETWSGLVVERASNVAIGQMGFKAAPSEDGSIELGYGINPSHWGRGYATEMVSALIGWATEQPDIKRITAETLADNLASIRVLEKLGFERMGQREDNEGLLLLWQS